MSQPMYKIFADLAGVKGYVQEDAIIEFYRDNIGIEVQRPILAKIFQVAHIDGQLGLSEFMHVSHVLLNANDDPKLSVFYAADQRQKLQLTLQQLVKALSAFNIALTENSMQYFMESYANADAEFSPAAFLEILDAIQALRK